MSKGDKNCQCTSMELGSKTLKLLQRPPEPQIPKSWLRIEPQWTKNPKLHIQLREGMYGKVYEYDGLDYTVHQFWLDDAMVCRMLRCYVIIRSRERIRPHFRGLDAPVRHREAYLCLQHHCYEHCRGFMNYLSEGTSSTMWEKCEKPEDDEKMATAGLFHIGMRIEPVWDVLTTERKIAYHHRFMGMDKMLPTASGDFWFAIDQIRYAMEIRFDERLYPTDRYIGHCERRVMTESENEEDYYYYNIWSTQQLKVKPFDTRVHKRRRLLANQIQLEERNIMIPRMPIVEAEQEAARTRKPSAGISAAILPHRLIPAAEAATLTPPLAMNAPSTAHPPMARTKKKSPPVSVTPTAMNGNADGESSAALRTPPPATAKSPSPAAEEDEVAEPPTPPNMIHKSTTFVVPKSNKKRKKKK